MSSIAADSSSDRPPRSPKKRRLEAVPARAGPAAATDEVSWTVYCLDGATFSVAVPEHARVADAKRAIGLLRDMPQYAMELFVKGKEEPLDDEKRLVSAEKVPLFMLPKEPSDRAALEALFKSCGGAGWTNQGGWMTDAALGGWFGVTVNAEGRVIELGLSCNNLAGPLPPEIQQLSALQRLYLFKNRLTGPVLAVLGQLGALTELDLGMNQLIGSIPVELGQLGALNWLNLCFNQLSGPIPAELGQLVELTYLALDTNRLTGATIPAELGLLRALTFLSLHTNASLSGEEAFRSHMREHIPECEVELPPQEDEDDSTQEYSQLALLYS